ncbi:uncharacterized protein BX664DRAFT_344597 [Halteromyces radiatus]|uniref:uncharacterized protein n=1 Tax=Halteromyces radiatus TaxID=101107 RepID=UPI00221EC302|nr:uncharacterized protein BX664DRAFT_344597 [Halteromyces radiatus]KAI8075963.1 hypothetical protein BX664DRAFT_344597 [Halteromyces radiatus]
METLNDDKLAYLGDYKDTIDVLPMELQRNFTLIRQLDDSAQDLMGKVAHEFYSTLSKSSHPKSTYDAVDRHCSRLDNDLQKFEDEQWIGPSRMGRTRSNSLQQQDTNVSTRTGHKRKQELDQEQGDYLSTEDAVHMLKRNAINLSDLPIDPNETSFLLLSEWSPMVTMVACDNVRCDIEWFHLDCVGLRAPPKGKWYCKNCASEVKGKKKL